MQKRLRQELQKLKKQIREQVWFPKNNFEGYSFRYGSALFLGLLTVLFILFFPQKNAQAASYILFLLAITLSSFLGNIKSGVLLLGFASAVLFMHYGHSMMLSPLYGIEMGLFIVSGLAISMLVPAAKRMNLISEFIQREHALKEQIKILTAQKLEAEKEIRVRDEFISIASHELKTPLTTTLLKLQTALHNVRHVTLANFSVQNLLDMLESAEHQTKRLAKMINDLLSISIIRTGRLDLELENCDVSEVTREVALRFTEKAEKEGVPIHIEASKSVIARCDKVRLEQVVTNLISNAMKYGNGKPIDIKVTNSGNTAKIYIKDHGIGISKEQRDRIFNLFERGVGTTDYKGLGIGLYISNQIVKAHNGKVTVQSRPHQGAEFIVEIPLSS